MTATGSTLQNPFTLKDEDGYIWLKGNLHSHSTNSDGTIPPQERVDNYVDQGYDFLSVTDHYKITRISDLSAPADFVLIQGVELHPDNPFGGQRHHFLAYNVQDDIDSTKMPPQHVIDAVREQGGSIWLAHPYWSSVNIRRDVLPLQGLSGIEVFNSVCRFMGRGESGVHWDDWMEHTNQIYPAFANDDAHRSETEERDELYKGWTMVRVKERSAEAIMQAIETGASYSSTGPEIHDIQLRTLEAEKDKAPLVEAHIRCSPAQRILAVCNVYGSQYYQNGETFTEATFTLRANSKWVRFEIVGPNGRKAWSNPYKL